MSMSNVIAMAVIRMINRSFDAVHFMGVPFANVIKANESRSLLKVAKKISF